MARACSKGQLPALRVAVGNGPEPPSTNGPGCCGAALHCSPSLRPRIM